MGSNCDSVASSLPWATCQILTWIIVSLWSLFFPVLALTLTMCYHVKAANSFLLAFNFGTSWQMPVLLRGIARVWWWRLATLLVYVPQSYVSFLAMRWTIRWMLDVFESTFVLSNVFFLLIVSVTRAIILSLTLASVTVLLIHLLWNTVDIFIVRPQDHIQEEGSLAAIATEASPLLRRSRVSDLEDPTPVAHIPAHRLSTASSSSVVTVNNHSPGLPDRSQGPSTHRRSDSPPLSEVMASVAGESPPDFNPYGISWVLGRWNSISIMLWIRACSQASEDPHLDRVSADGSSRPSLPALIADEGSNQEDHSDGDKGAQPSQQHPEA